MALITKLTSSLEKIFVKDDPSNFPSLEKISVLKGERFHLQFALKESDISFGLKRMFNFKIETDLDIPVTVRRVQHIPCRVPSYQNAQAVDKNYLSYEPGLYPDALMPVKENEIICAPYGQSDSFWFTVDVPETANAGAYEIKVKLVGVGTDEVFAEEKLSVKIINAVLPENELAVTQWFHCDCLATYYNTKAFDEQHWIIIENYINTAVKNGINMILTPVITPPLDTAVGGERMTMQLVDIYKNGNDYSFKFDKLDRWVDMCLRNGVKYFEIAHFFTQWGAAHAPKVVAFVDGSDTAEKIFGWETDACGEEYTHFLRSFVSALIEYFKGRGIDDKCYYHISDEPSMAHLEAYKNAKAVIADLLKDYKIIDALSNYEFYATGAVTNPIPANNHIEPFIENKVPDLWTYYCCSQYVNVSNRFFAMPSARTRIIGTQFYKYNIVGFLQWGYNFYYTWHSLRAIDPYVVSDGDYWVPAGDAFSVYPASDGTAYESLRLDVFYDALQDTAALKLCEKLLGREKTMELLEEDANGPITFSSFPKEAEFILNLREKINACIEEAVK
ncbi:MAG: DUF4091 domain-containing protein [Ruminococcaceae bacterium]|nr:DUF4091 domain-containing protein [Oscillospiraceae bacterium]